MSDFVMLTENAESTTVLSLSAATREMLLFAVASGVRAMPIFSVGSTGTSLRIALRATPTCPADGLLEDMSVVRFGTSI